MAQFVSAIDTQETERRVAEIAGRLEGLEAGVERLGTQLERNHEALESGQIGLKSLAPRMTELRARLEQLRALSDELLRERDQAKARMPTRNDVLGQIRELGRLLPKVVEGEREAVERGRELVQTYVA